MGRGIRFTTEFKREAVRLALSSGRPRAEIAEDLGVGQLLASGDSDSNRVNGSIECVGGVAGDGTGDELDWDGDGADDGTIDGDYKCP